MADTLEDLLRLDEIADEINALLLANRNAQGDAVRQAMAVGAFSTVHDDIEAHVEHVAPESFLGKAGIVPIGAFRLRRAFQALPAGVSPFDYKAAFEARATSLPASLLLSDVLDAFHRVLDEGREAAAGMPTPKLCIGFLLPAVTAATRQAGGPTDQAIRAYLGGDAVPSDVAVRSLLQAMRAEVKRSRHNCPNTPSS